MKNLKAVSSILLVCMLVLAFSGTIFAQTANLTPPLINVIKKAHPIAMPPGSGEVTYDYTVLNMGIVAISNVTLIDDGCSSLSFISGDANSNAKLDTTETWKYRCVTSISQTTTNTVTASGNADGFTAVDTANATVFVGVPLPPPLIHLEKVPSVFILPTGGGAVTYTYKVTNPGPAPLSNVGVTDDKCIGLPGLVAGNQGDLNQNNILENNETWNLTCLANLSQTTTNTGRVQGSANGLTVSDTSSVTVVVSPPGLPTTGGFVPGLPNTGFSPAERSIPWNIIIPAGIISIITILIISRKKEIV